MESAIQFLFQIIILIFSVVIHEVSHGYAALMLGDKTAQYAGRLTLNPIKHLDPFGSIVLPTLSFLLGGFIFGWAKPVPYNPYNLKNQKWGPAVVGAAGPAANAALALIFGLFIRFAPAFTGVISGAFIFNFLSIASTIAFLNLVLAFFNMVPIPPLDGSKVLFSLMPYSWYEARVFLEQYGFFLLLILIFFSARFIIPFVLFFFRLIAGTYPFL
jgi:Zn-dependent protease